MEGVTNLAPDPVVEDASKQPDVKQSYAPTGAMYDPFTHGCCATSRYSGYEVAGTQVVRKRLEIGQINTKPSTLAYVADIRKLLEDCCDGMFKKYEAYRVRDMSVTFHDPGNAISKGGHLYFCSCQDPDRDLGNDFLELIALRTHDAQLAEFNGQQGMNYIYDVPVADNIFFTMDDADTKRMSSPGQIMSMMNWRGKNYPEDVPDVDSRTLTPIMYTLTARVDFYCSTIRLPVSTITKIGSGLQLGDTSHGVYSANANEIFMELVLKAVPVSGDKPSDIFFADPVPATFILDFVEAASPNNDNSQVKLNTWISRMRWTSSAGTPKSRVLVDVSQLLQGYNASDLTFGSMVVGSGFSGTYLSTEVNEGISKTDGQKEIWI